jgi:hypothetical protein
MKRSCCKGGGPIRRGRADARTAVAIAVVAASRSNPALAAFQKSRGDKRNAAKIARVAVIRKRLVLYNPLNPGKITIC